MMGSYSRERSDPANRGNNSSHNRKAKGGTCESLGLEASNLFTIKGVGVESFRPSKTSFWSRIQSLHRSHNQKDEGTEGLQRQSERGRRSSKEKEK